MKSAVITFGRMSPPTLGHQKLIEHVVTLAKKQHADPMIFLSHSFDKKKNPLPYDVKVKFLREIFGPFVINDTDSTNRTVFEALTNLANNGYDSVVLVVGSDRVADFKSKITPYLNNGKASSINLKSFDVVSAGERDPDDEESVAGISGSKMRQFVLDDDYPSFEKWLPKGASAHQAKIIFDSTKAKLNEVTLISYSEFTNEIL